MRLATSTAAPVDPAPAVDAPAPAETPVVAQVAPRELPGWPWITLLEVLGAAAIAAVLAMVIRSMGMPRRLRRLADG